MECQSSEQGPVSPQEQKTEVLEQRRWKSPAGSQLGFILVLRAVAGHDTHRPETVCHDTLGVHVAI